MSRDSPLIGLGEIRVGGGFCSKVVDKCTRVAWKKPCRSGSDD